MDPVWTVVGLCLVCAVACCSDTLWGGLCVLVASVLEVVSSVVANILEWVDGGYGHK